MPAFDEAEQLRLLNRAVEQRAARMDREHGTWTGDATREGRNVPMGRGYPNFSQSVGFATGYDGTETTTPFVSDYSMVGGPDIVVGS